MPEYADLRPARQAKNITVTAPASNADSDDTTLSLTPTETGYKPLDVNWSIELGPQRNACDYPGGNPNRCAVGLRIRAKPLAQPSTRRAASAVVHG